MTPLHLAPPLDDDQESADKLLFWVYEACRQVHDPVRLRFLIMEPGRVKHKKHVHARGRIGRLMGMCIEERRICGMPPPDL